MVKARSEEPTKLDKWLTRSAAADKAGVSLATIKRWQNKEKIDAIWDETRQCWLIDPEQLESAASSAPDDEEVMGQAASMVFTSANKQIESAQKFAERLEEIGLKERALMLELFGEERKVQEALRDRISKLENERTEMFDKYEEGRSRAHEHELERMKFHAAEEKKKLVITMLGKYAPLVAHGFGVKVPTLASSPAVTSANDNNGKTAEDAANDNVTGDDWIARALSDKGVLTADDVIEANGVLIGLMAALSNEQVETVLTMVPRPMHRAFLGARAVARAVAKAQNAE